MASTSIIKSKALLTGSLQAGRLASAGLDGAREISDLTALKRGSGYRSSFSGIVATVFGSTGCVGTVVCNRLGKVGSQIVIPYRGEHYRYFPYKVCGDLGQVLFTPYHLKDEESIIRAMKYSDVVINAIGREYETKNFKFEDVNVSGPARLAKLAAQAGVKRFVHISSINAREKPDKAFLPKGSRWLKTKWQGENAVKEEFPDATIFRSTDIYGHEDSFTSHFSSRFRLSSINSRALPLWKKGEHTVKAPVHCGDLVSGIMAAITDDSTKGVTFEAYGPETYKLSDIVDWIYYYTNKDAASWNYRRTDLRFDPSVMIKAKIFQSLPLGQRSYGKMSLEKLELTSISDDILGLPNLMDLGVNPGTIAEKMPPHLVIWKSAMYHYETSFYREMPKIPAVEKFAAKQFVQDGRKSLIQSLL